MNRNRILSGMLASVTAISAVAAAGAPVFAAESSSSEKEEVLYVTADANGSTKTVNAVNIFGSGDVTDYGNYTSVKMLTSTASITQDGDKITFSTDEKKVYYQGTLENVELPWNLDITYTLDGKEIAPEELAGQSGALNIHLSITENTACNSDFYDNYALQASLSLDTERCTNIVADGATLANVGADKQISYTVLPGKGLDAEITADVTDFEMDAISINGVALNLNIDIDDAELMDKVTEIMDATRELNDGTTTLSDGTATLSDAGSSLNSGANTLYQATDTLDSGVSSLNQGIRTLQSGLDQLTAQSSSLTDGSSQVLGALQTIQTSLSGVSLSTDQLQQLTDSSAAIKQGIADLYAGAQTLQAQVSYAAYQAVMNQNGLNLDELKAGNASAIQTLSAQIADLQTALGQIQAIPGYESNEQLAAQAAQLSAQITSLSQIVTLLTGNTAALQGTESYLNALSAGTASLVDGIASLNASYAQFDAAITDLAGKLGNLTVQMSTLKSGIDQLVANYQTLDSGIGTYTDGVATVTAGYTQLVDGAQSLSSGSKELLSGTDTFRHGTSDLYDGILELNDGAKELNDGTNEFYDKTSDMDTQVEDTIDEMVDSLSGNGDETVSFVSDKNTNVDSVQFVIKTSAIEKEEAAAVEEAVAEPTNFWQKLLALFKK